MQNHHGFKTFLKALEHVHTEPQETKKYLQDKRLTSQEKKLLSFYLRIRENDYSLIPELMNDTSFDAFPFLNGLHFYFLGVALLCKGESQKAESYFHKSLPLMGDSYNDAFFRRMTFRATINLFYTNANLKRFPEMEVYYKKSQDLGVNSVDEQITIRLVDVCFHLMRGEYLPAEDALEDLEKLKPQMNDIQIMNYLIEKFDFRIKVDNFKGAASVLEEMKKHRAHRLSANFKYMDKMLRFIDKGERIYLYEKDFAGHDDLYHMVMVIKALDESDVAAAKKAWTKLETISPSSFKPDFHYVGDKCLFSLALYKSQTHEQPSSVRLNLSSEYSPQEILLINAIQQAQGGQLKKEDLLKLVYGKSFESKDDLMGLTSAIYRINKKGGVSIKSKKGCYYLAELKKHSVA